MTFLFLGIVCAEDISDANQTLTTDSEVSQESIKEIPDEIQTAGQKITDVNVTFNPRYGVEGQNVFITPTATYNGTEISGNITFYEDQSHKNYYSNMSTNGGYLKFKMNDTENNVNYWWLYYTFTADDGRYDDEADNYAYFLNMDTNNITLTGNGKTGSFDAYEVALKVNVKYYKSSGISSLLHVFVNGTEVGTFTSVNSTYTLNASKYKGKIDVYVKYDGYINASTKTDYYAPAESNHLTVNIAPFDLSFTNTTYGNVTANVTMPQAGICELIIASKQYRQLINFTQAGSKLVKITGVPASSTSYTVKAAIQGTSYTKEKNLTISKAASKLTIGNVKGNHTSVNDVHSFTVSVEGKGKITTNCSSKQFNVNETVVLNNSLLKAGRNKISVKYSGDENYTASSADIIFNLFSNTTVTLKANNTTPKYGQSISVTPTVTGDSNVTLKNGTVTYYIADTAISNALSPTETFSFTVDKSAAFNITAKYSGFDDYRPSEGTIEIKAQKADNNVSLTIQNMTYGESINIVISNAADGLYTVHIGQYNVSVKVTNRTGKNTTAKPNLPAANNYKANLTFENKNYQTTGTATFNVAPAINNITLFIDDISYGENLTVEISDAVAGDYIVSIEDKKITVKVNESGNGKTTTFVDLKIKNDYTATASLANPNYITNASTKFNVYKYRSIVEIISCNNITYPNDLIAQINITNKTFATYEITDSSKNIVRMGIVDSNTITVKGLNAGNYTLTVKDQGNENVSGDSESKAFTVAKLDTPLFSSDDVQNSTVTITMHVNESATGFVELEIAGKKYYVPVENGTSKFSHDFAVGIYYAKITYLGDANFNKAEDEVQFTITKEDKTLNRTDVEVDVETQDNNVTITVSVNTDATGLIEINIDDELAYILIKDGTAVLHTILPEGRYEVIATYLGDDSYESSFASEIFNVHDHIKANTTIKAAPKVDEYNVTLTVSIDENATGFIEISISGNRYYVPAEKGKALFTNVFAPGTYTANVTYLGDSNFNANSTSTTFNVTGFIIHNTTIEMRYVMEGNDAIIGIHTNVTGELTVYIDGSKQNITLEDDGNAILSIPSIGYGKHIITAIYAGDDRHKAASESITIQIDTYPTKFVNVTIGQYELTAKLVSDGKTLTNQNVTCIIDGKEYNTTTDDEGLIKIEEIAGKVIELKYNGNGTYLPTSIELNLKDINPEKNNATLDIEYEINGTEAAITITTNAYGDLLIFIDGNKTTVKISAKGIATLTVPIDYGEHTVVAVFEGNDEYKPAENTTTIYLEAFDTKFTNITVEKDTLTAVLVLATGDSLANQSITYILDGKEVQTYTDENGLLIIEHVLNKPLTIKYEGNESFMPTSVELNLTSLVPQRTNTQILGDNFQQYALEYDSGERGQYFKTQLVDANGKPIANKTIYIGYNGKTLERTTDKNGYTTVQINLRDQNRITFAVVFLGDDDYAASLSVYLITINKKPVTITAAAKTYKAATKTKKYTVTLKTIKGSSIDGKTYFAAGKKVTLKVNGKIYTAKTNAKGQATFKITNLKKKGKFTAVIKYAGSTTYKAVSKKVKLTIK